MKKDITTKETIKTITKDIARYILELDVKDIEFVDKELQRIEKREADIVALCNVNGAKAILHLEIQNDNDKTMHHRMLRYYTDIKQRFETLPVYQYVVYIGRPKLSMREEIVETNLNFRYNIVDMHTIDCEKFLSMDSPDALVLAILCDFNGRDEKDIITYIITRLRELTKDNNHKLGKYMLALEELSTNRNLQNTLEEVERMLRDMNLEELPGYRIALERGMERGIERGMERGIAQTTIQNAIIMVKKFKLSVEDVAKELNVSLDELKKHLK